MAFTIVFTPKGMTTEKYNEIITRLNQAGSGAPEGRLYHVCYGDPANLQVTDVWESMDTFDRFGATLMPIMQQLGVDPGQPIISPIHNTIIG